MLPSHFFSKSISSFLQDSDADSLRFLSDSDDCDFELHFMEENPGLQDDENQEENEADIGHDPPDWEPHDLDGGDDPDDPNDVELGHSESSSNDDEHISLDLNSMNTPLRFYRRRLVKHEFIVMLAKNIKKNETYQSLLQECAGQNMLYGKKYFPTEPKQLWKVLQRKKSAGVTTHAVCKRCTGYLGIRNRVADPVRCRSCNVDIALANTDVFVTLSLQRQFSKFLLKRGIAEVLRYREARVKAGENTIEDIYDSRKYKELQQEGGPLASNTNYSFVMNVDSLRLGKSSKFSATPIFLRLNELPPNLRQKYRFLAGLWISEKEPNMSTFLTPVVLEVNKVSQEGVLWKPDGVNEVRSLFIPTCVCADSKARYTLFNMTQYNGRYGKRV